MTQIACVVAVANVFIGLWTEISTFDSQRRGRGLYVRRKYLICRNSSQKYRVFKYEEGGGIIAGFYIISCGVISKLSNNYAFQHIHISTQ